MSDALVPVEPTSILTAAPVAQVVEMQRQYRELCDGLLDDSDRTRIGKKMFTNKSGWRKLAVAFNVSDELRTKEIHLDTRDRVIRAEMVVRATAPNGRFMDGYGACDIHDRCCEAGTCELDEFWKDSGNRRHRHCAPDCDGRHAFSNPAHDVPSTAMTRATNRAFADLFGMGEVSAEEVSGQRDADPETGEVPPPANRRSRPRSRDDSGRTSEPRDALPAQYAEIARLTDELGLGHPVSAGGLTFTAARNAIADLRQKQEEKMKEPF